MICFRAMILVLPVLLACCAAAQAGPSLTAEAVRDLRRARQEMQAGRYGEAEAILAPLAEPGKAPAVVWFLLGNVRLLDERPEAAWAAYARARDLEPDNPGLARNAARACSMLDRHEQAAGLYRTAYELEKGGGGRELLQAAVSWGRAGRWRECLQVLRLAQGEHGVDETRRTRLEVKACLELELWGQAESAIRRAMGAAPNDARLWRLLASARRAREDWVGAASALEAARALEGPRSAQVGTLASLYRYIQAPALAARRLEQVRACPGSWRACLDAARSWGRARRFDPALRLAGRALEGNATSAACMVKARLEYEAGKPRQADATLVRCLNLDSDLAEARLLRGFAAWDRGDWDAAAREFQRAARSGEHRATARRALQAVNQIVELAREPAGPARE
jgi:tetratricopeptide (TPR) repeat protein